MLSIFSRQLFSNVTVNDVDLKSDGESPGWRQKGKTNAQTPSARILRGYDEKTLPDEGRSQINKRDTHEGTGRSKKKSLSILVVLHSLTHETFSNYHFKMAST